MAIRRNWHRAYRALCPRRPSTRLERVFRPANSRRPRLLPDPISYLAHIRPRTVDPAQPCRHRIRISRDPHSANAQSLSQMRWQGRVYGHLLCTYHVAGVRTSLPRGEVRHWPDVQAS